MTKLPKNECTNNGTKTFIYKNQEGQTFIRVSVVNYYGHGHEYTVEAKWALYFYPLYAFYDWKYSPKDNGIILSKTTGTVPPEETQKLINSGFYFTDCFNDNLEGKANKIYWDNLGVMLTLKKWGFTTMLDNFTDEDIKNNHRLRNKIISDIQSQAIDKQDLIIEKNNKITMKRNADIHNTLSNLNEEEQRALIVCGLAYTTTRLMTKVLHARTFESPIEGVDD